MQMVSLIASLSLTVLLLNCSQIDREGAAELEERPDEDDSRESGWVCKFPRSYLDIINVSDGHTSLYEVDRFVYKVSLTKPNRQSRREAIVTFGGKNHPYSEKRGEPGKTESFRRVPCEESSNELNCRLTGRWPMSPILNISLEPSGNGKHDSSYTIGIGAIDFQGSCEQESS